MGEQGPLIRLAYRMLGTVEDAEDVVQDAYERLERQGEKVRDPERYLMRVVANLAIDRLRAEKVRRRDYVGPWLPEPVAEDEAPADLLELAQELDIGFMLLLEQLSPAERVVFVLREGFDFSFDEIGALLHSLERPREVVSLATQAAEWAEQSGAKRPLARSLSLLELAEMKLHGPGDGARIRRALSIFEEVGDLLAQSSMYGNLGVVAYYAGRWDEAAEAYGRARDLSIRCGNSVEAALDQTNIAELMLNQGRLDEAEAALVDAKRVVTAAHWDEGICVVNIQLGHVLIERGRLDEAETLLGTTVDEFNAMGQPHSALEATIVRASGKVLAGQSAEALELLAAALDGVDGDTEMFGPKCALMKALALDRLGRTSEALQSAREGRSEALALHLPFEAALLGLAESELDLFPDLGRSARRKLEDLGVRQTPRSYQLPVSQ